MGNPRDAMDGPQHTGSSQSSSQTKATFSGMTALGGILALIVSIISVAVPYWGFYAPAGASYYSSGNQIFTIAIPIQTTFQFEPFYIIGPLIQFCLTNILYLESLKYWTGQESRNEITDFNKIVNDPRTSAP